jgi:hypothetical protein
MIQTLAITIAIESTVIVGYAKWRKKPLMAILVTSLLANLITQILLWLALTTFPANYLSTLLVMEILIVGLEAAMLHFYRQNLLNWSEALALSACMNLASFGIGWFLKV